MRSRVRGKRIVLRARLNVRRFCFLVVTTSSFPSFGKFQYCVVLLLELAMLRAEVLVSTRHQSATI